MSENKYSHLIKESLIKELVKRAQAVKVKAYCKYSNFHVGAVLIDDKNKIHEGVNIENQAFSCTVCAERNAISRGVAHGLKKIKVIAISADTDVPCAPCGSCRQFISEFSDENTLIILSCIEGNYKVLNRNDMLPYAFTPTVLKDS